MAGKPIRTDECTLKHTTVAFARILVKIDVSQPLVKQVGLKSPTGILIEQVIEYEWIPIFCHKCQCLGHDCNATQPVVPARPRKRRRANAAPNNEQWIAVGNMNPNAPGATGNRDFIVSGANGSRI